MRQQCIAMVHRLAQRDPRVVFIGSDLSPGLLKEMKKEFPDRHYMEGVSEAHVVGMACGMALDGFVPYVNTIATFITRRCFEQVAVDACLHKLPIRLIGNGGGLVYAPLGPTHLAIEDVAIMRALPNMTVVAVADAPEMTRLMDATLDWKTPIYIRLGKGGEPVVSREENGFAIGKAIPMREAKAAAGACAFVTTGVMTARCLRAAETLAERGIDCSVLHMHTIKPLDGEALLRLADTAAAIVVVEEHVLTGGLGSAVLELLADARPGRIPPLLRLGLPDRFPANYGSQDDLLGLAGLQPEQLVDRVAEFLQQRPRA